MSEKTQRHIDLKSIIQVVALGLTALTVGPPLIHIDNATRAIQAVFTGETGCLNSVESSVVGYPFDVIVVPGASHIKTGDGGFEPGEQGKMRLEAAAIAYYHKMAPYIVLLNGTVTPGEDKFTELKFIQRAYARIAGENQVIPQNDIFAENTSINTATNMDELALIAKIHQIRSALIVTNRHHEPRATLFACRRGIPSSSLSAEEILLSEHPEYADAIQKMYATSEMEYAQRKETLELILAIWDPDALIPTYLRKNGR